MPELPEVETVRRGLTELLGQKINQIKKVEMSDKPLRFFPEQRLLPLVKNQKVQHIHRKAKYLLFELENHYLLSHLGMTGSWRLEEDRRKHDHVRIHFSDGRVLTYHDARRFGMFDVIAKDKIMQDERLAHLGPDPVVDRWFDGDYLYKQTRGRHTSIKALIMNQQIVVGVGNIYANEALYLAGIHPNKKASRLSQAKAQLLAKAIREVLVEAIFCGGTTISDFKQAGGSEGYFQNLLLVYGRDKEACLVCGTALRSQAIVGRNSFWCPKCQPL